MTTQVKGKPQTKSPEISVNPKQDAVVVNPDTKTLISKEIPSVDISNAQLQLQIQVMLHAPNCYSENKIVDNLVAQLYQVGFRLCPS